MTASELIWLRPAWLWGFIPLLLLVVIWIRKRRDKGAWDSVVDPALQPYVIDGGSQSRSAAPIALFAAWALALLLLSGPVWEQQEVPVFEAQQAEVVLFDLSRSMLADDVAPNRLSRARFKLADLLTRSDGRLTGLIGFAERPYVISPLTEDSQTIEAFVPSLDPSIMPVQGSRLDLAVMRAVQLLEQAGVAQGHIIVISDAQIESQDIEAASVARAAGHRLSALAVGTTAGVPLRDEEGKFLQQANGSIVVPQLDMDGMQALASAGGGLAQRLSTDSRDLDLLERVRAAIAIQSGSPEAVGKDMYWLERAPWLLWVLVVAALFLFRKGVIA